MQKTENYTELVHFECTIRTTLVYILIVKYKNNGRLYIIYL